MNNPQRVAGITSRRAPCKDHASRCASLRRRTYNAMETRPALMAKAALADHLSCPGWSTRSDGGCQAYRHDSRHGASGDCQLQSRGCSGGRNERRKVVVATSLWTGKKNRCF